MESSERRRKISSAAESRLYGNGISGIRNNHKGIPGGKPNQKRKGSSEMNGESAEVRKMYAEKERSIPVSGKTEVLVAGGGPAGIGAALGAARSGAKVMMVEQSNVPGGMATSGMMSDWSPGTDSPLMKEIMTRTLQNPSMPPVPNEGSLNCIPHECLTSTLFQMLEEAGVELRLYTMIADAVVEDGTLRGVITESKSGREMLEAEVVVDATGDGDVAARAGAAFRTGREEDGLCQPMTLMFRIAGVDYSRAIFPPSFESYMDVPDGEIQSLGKSILPYPAGHVLLYRTRIPGEVCVNMTNAIRFDGTDARQLTEAEKLCRKQIDAIIPFLRRYVPGYENCYLVAVARNVGVRETRHFRGLYTVTAEDILEARVFPDWIATKNYFNFDIHSLKGPGLDEHGVQRKFRSKGAYTIPYRACVPEKIDGLLLAGRSISGTHKAHSNYRVMPICLNVGQGVGVAAALAARGKIRPREVSVPEVQEILKRQGVSVE